MIFHPAIYTPHSQIFHFIQNDLHIKNHLQILISLFLLFSLKYTNLHIKLHPAIILCLSHFIYHLFIRLRIWLHSNENKFPNRLLYHQFNRLRIYLHLHGIVCLFHLLYLLLLNIIFNKLIFLSTILQYIYFHQARFIRLNRDALHFFILLHKLIHYRVLFEEALLFHFCQLLKKLVYYIQLILRSFNLVHIQRSFLNLILLPFFLKKIYFLKEILNHFFQFYCFIILKIFQFIFLLHYLHYNFFRP